MFSGRRRKTPCFAKNGHKNIFDFAHTNHMRLAIKYWYKSVLMPTILIVFFVAIRASYQDKIPVVIQNQDQYGNIKLLVFSSVDGG